MPKWGYMLEGIVVEWLKNEGDKVERGEPLLVVETEKVTQEVESPATGILLKRTAPVGSVVPAGEVVAAIGEEDERPLAESLLPDETTGRPVEKGSEILPSSRQPSGRILISPAARRLAQERGLDISALAGTGPGGRIIRTDVLRAIEASKIPPTEADLEVVETVPLVGKRKTISDRMSKSSREAAQVTIVAEIDASNMVAVREKSPLGEEGKKAISYTDMLVWAVAKALRETPLMNSALEGDLIKIHKDVNVGVAVALHDGLTVPVIRNADNLSLREIASLRRDLTERARQDRLSIQDVINGTFTITNLGMHGVDIFTPIVNPPQTGILGIGRIREKPVVWAGEVTVKPVVSLSLSFDHRVVDGVPASKFLQLIRQILEMSDFT